MPKWTVDQMRRAVEAYTDAQESSDKLSMREVARRYTVPVESLRTYINGQPIGVKAGRPGALSPEEEDGIVAGLLHLHSIGFPATRLKLKLLVLEVISDGRSHSFGPSGPSADWLSAFIEKHKDKIRLRKARIMDVKRVDANNYSELEYFFKEYEHYMEKHKLPASQVYNADETGCERQGGSLLRVIAGKGAREVSKKRGSNRDNITVLVSISASGYIIPYLFIFKGKRVPSNLLHGAASGSVADNAFIDTETFCAWIEHFVKHIPPTRPVLLILDNHTSHVALECLERFVAHGIDVLTLPPHTTHLTQPLDAGCFRSFKAAWRTQMDDWCSRTNATSLPKQEVAGMVTRAVNSAWTPEIILSSWASCGLWPIDRSKVLENTSVSNNPNPTSQYSRYKVVEDALPLDQLNPRDLW